jgi:hypothetical protein
VSYRPIGKPVTPIEQGNLFSAQELAGTYTAHRSQLDLTAPALIQWKTRVIQYQQSPQQSSQADAIAPDITQGNLFDLTPTQPELKPFTLPRQNTQFWRWKPSDVGVSALYFVIDYDCNLLLYIGETVKSDSRWLGEHDCKRYLLHYQQAHYNHDLPTQLGIAFWKDAPQKTRDRQRLESELIRQWRSPFNKENWKFWATPFVQHE